MAGSSANVRVWEGADVYYAPVGTTLPTDTTTALNAAFKPIGILSTDGLTKTRGKDVKSLFGWGVGKVRNTKKNFEKGFQFVAMEDNDANFVLSNPGSTSATATGVTTRTVKREVTKVYAWVIQLTDGTITKRLVVPRGEAQADGEKKLSDDDSENTQYTVDALAAADGTFFLEITDDPGAATP
jgi:hypothetical protein